MSRLHRAALSTPIALLLALAVAHVAFALTWSARHSLTSSGSGAVGGIAHLDGSSAVISYLDRTSDTTFTVDVRRTTTNGTTWNSPQTLATDGDDSDVAAMAPFVDVIWTQHGRVRYARSSNSGVSFGTSVALSPKGGEAINIDVARGSGGLGGNGVVIVAWQNGKTEAVNVRVSNDGGSTFGSASSFASNFPPEGTSVAAGDGVVYLAYHTTEKTIKVRRSTDAGQTWSAPVTITSNADEVFDDFSITAIADHAYIAYSDLNPAQPSWGTIRYRRTTNSGASWAAERQLSPASWKAGRPQAELNDGVLRVVYEKNVATGTSVEYQKSSDGLHWSSPQLVDSDGAFPCVTYAGNVIVPFDGGDTDVYVRTGS